MTVSAIPHNLFPASKTQYDHSLYTQFISYYNFSEILGSHGGEDTIVVFWVVTPCGIFWVVMVCGIFWVVMVCGIPHGVTRFLLLQSTLLRPVHRHVRALIDSWDTDMCSYTNYLNLVHYTHGSNFFVQINELICACRQLRMDKSAILWY
jgi:hypothetical protein